MARIGERVYLLAGFTRDSTGRGTTARTLWVYDTIDDRWEEAGEIPVDIHHAGLVTVDGKLYLVGGYVGSSLTPTAEVHVYDPDAGAWSAGAPMPTPRGALAYTVLDGRIHAIGGTVAGRAARDTLDPQEHHPHPTDASVGTHEVYDPRADAWERLPPMPTPRDHHVAGTVDGVIVVTGGRAGGDLALTVTEIWDPSARSWRKGAPLPTGRSGVAAAESEGWFYVLGGESLGATHNEAERYRVDEDRWERLPAMPTARHGLGAATVDGAIYVISGGPEPGMSYGTANERYLP